MDNYKVDRSRMKILENGAAAFYDRRGKLIGAYDSEMEGSLDHISNLLSIAREYDMIEKGKYTQWSKFLGIENSESNETRETHSVLLKKLLKKQLNIC